MNFCAIKPTRPLAAAALALFLAACGSGDDPAPAPETPPAPQAAVMSGTAAIGAALVGGEVRIIDRAGADACDTGSSLVTGAAGDYTCVLLATAEAPFVIVVTDPAGLVSPMISLATGRPAAGETATANVSRLTTAIAAQLAPNGDAFAFVNDTQMLASLDATSLDAVKANVVAQLADVLVDLGMDPASFDPVTTPFVGGSNAGADKLLDQVHVHFENGAPMLVNVLNPDAPAVPMAGAASTPPAKVAKSAAPAAFSVTELDIVKTGFDACFAVAGPSRFGHAACGSLFVDDAPSALTGGATYLHNGYQKPQALGPLWASDDVTGIAVNRPELLRYVPRPDGKDEAVVNLKFADRNGYPDNRILVLKKFPGTATAQRASDWWLYGSRRAMDVRVSASIRLQEQTLSEAAQVAFNAGASRFQSGLNVYIAKPCANANACPNTEDVRYVRVTGPGLPTAGLVYADVQLPQSWMAILNATGTIPAGDQVYATTSNNIFYLQRSRGISGADAFALRSNPFVNNATPSFPYWAHPAMYGEAPSSGWSFDLSRVPAWSEYTFEVFRGTQTTTTEVYTTRMLTPVVPAAYAAVQQWHAPTAATKALASDGAPAATSLDLAWTANLYAERIESVQVYTFNGTTAVNSASTGVAKGRTSVTVTPVGGEFGPLSVANVGTSRTLQFRYRVLDGSYKDQTVTFN